jgi:hypothetical protein
MGEGSSRRVAKARPVKNDPAPATGQARTATEVNARLMLDNTSVFDRVYSNGRICGMMKHRCRHLIRILRFGPERPERE